MTTSDLLPVILFTGLELEVSKDEKETPNGDFGHIGSTRQGDAV